MMASRSPNALTCSTPRKTWVRKCCVRRPSAQAMR
jgi:hypothetical protein